MGDMLAKKGESYSLKSDQSTSLTEKKCMKCVILTGFEHYPASFRQFEGSSLVLSSYMLLSLRA